MEFIQNPGETLYLPSKTAHAVLNLDETIAVTENMLGVDALKDLPLHLMNNGLLLPEEEYEQG